jgi:hypothetical protein
MLNQEVMSNIYGIAILQCALHNARVMCQLHKLTVIAGTAAERQVYLSCFIIHGIEVYHTFSRCEDVARSHLQRNKIRSNMN